MTNMCLFYLYQNTTNTKKFDLCAYFSCGIMMTSSFRNISAFLALCAGNSLVTGEFPSHKGQRPGALMFSLICAWINGSVNNREAGDLRRHHYDVTVMVVVMMMSWHENTFRIIGSLCREIHRSLTDVFYRRFLQILFADRKFWYLIQIYFFASGSNWQQVNKVRQAIAETNGYQAHWCIRHQASMCLRCGHDRVSANNGRNSSNVFHENMKQNHENISSFWYNYWDQ